jgi:hypothetical protein
VRKAAEQIDFLAPLKFEKPAMRSKFEVIAARGACVRDYDADVTIDLGAWQFRRGPRIAWCCSTLHFFIRFNGGPRDRKRIERRMRRRF